MKLPHLLLDRTEQRTTDASAQMAPPRHSMESTPRPEAENIQHSMTRSGL